jgi:hypothetical protein
MELSLLLGVLVDGHGAWTRVESVQRNSSYFMCSVPLFLLRFRDLNTPLPSDHPQYLPFDCRQSHITRFAIAIAHTIARLP